MNKNKKKKTNFNYESIPLGYYDKIFNKKKGIQSKWHHIHYNFVKKIMGKYNKHLDIACAGGTFIGNLDKKKKSFGIDVSNKQINYAKEKYENKNHKFYRIKANIIPFRNNFFDVITNLQLMEHLTIQDNTKLINEAYRVLNKKGKLIITTPNYLGPWVIVEKIVNFFGAVSYDDQHITFFNKNNIKDFLKKFGFKKITITTNMSFAPFFAFFGWKLPDFIQKIEDKYFNNSYRLFLVVVCEK